MAAVNNNPEVATGLLEQAIVQATINTNATHGTPQLQNMRQMLAQQKKKVAPATGQDTFPLGLIPPKTGDPAQMTTEQDIKNFKALCRGQDILPAHYRKHLNCFYSTRNDPYFTIHPVAVEVMHKEPHEALVFHHILSDLRLGLNAWIEDGKYPLVDKISQRTNWITGLQTSMKYDKHGEGKKEEYEYLQLARYGIVGYYDVHQDPNFIAKSI